MEGRMDAWMHEWSKERQAHPLPWIKKRGHVGNYVEICRASVNVMAFWKCYDFKK